MLQAQGYVLDSKHDRYPISVHVFLLDDEGRVLLMRRAGGFGAGMLGLPAGHIDMGETPVEALVREVEEELGVRLQPGSVTAGSTMFRRSLQPRMDVFFLATAWSGEPVVREPGKCTDLVWVDPARFPVDVLDYIPQAWADTREGRVLREFGFERSTA